MRYTLSMSSESAPRSPIPEARKACADWLLEISALLAVFPWLDQLVIHSSSPFNWKVASGTLFFALSLSAFGFGLLVQSARRQKGCFAASVIFILSSTLIPFGV